MLRNCPINDLVLPVATTNPIANGGAEFRYIDISSVNREAKTITSANEINPKDAPSRARQVVKAGDILVSTVRPNLNAVAQVPEGLDGAVASTGFTVLRPKESGLDSRYLFNWVRSPAFVAKMVKLSTGATYPAVSDRIVKESTIPIPETLKEQRRIAAVLDKADEVRQKRRQAIKKLDELLQSVFLDMFGDPITNPKQLKSEILDEVTINITDGKHGDCRPADGSGYYFISAKDIRDGRIDYNDARQIEPEDFFEVHRRTRLEEGDVLITNSGTIGKTAVVTASSMLDRTTFQKSVAIIKPKRDRLDSVYLRTLLRMGFAKLMREASGSSQKNLLLGQLRNFELPIPSIDSQNEFSRRAQKIEILKEALLSSSITLNDLFKSLQQRAFTDKLFSESAEAIKQL